MISRRRGRAALSLAVAVVATVSLAPTTPAPASSAPGARLPDVAVLAVTAPASVTAGEWLTATAQVANRGRAASRPAKVRFVLSRDARPGGDIAFSPRVRAQGLPPGRKVKVSGRLEVPRAQEGGTYYVLACATPGGRDAVRSNDCGPARRITVPEAPWEGRLSGTLTFTRAIDRVEEGDEEHTSDQLQLGFDIEVDENAGGWAAFQSIDSAYTYNGTRTRLRTSRWCRTDERGTSHGGGPITQTWDPYYDVLYGKFARTDHSEVRLTTQLPYETTTTVTDTPLQEHGCEAGTKVTSYDARAIDSLLLRQVRRSPDEVVYEVVEAEHAESQPTTWQQITGTLVFTHAD